METETRRILSSLMVIELEKSARERKEKIKDIEVDDKDPIVLIAIYGLIAAGVSEDMAIGTVGSAYQSGRLKGRREQAMENVLSSVSRPSTSQAN